MRTALSGIRAAAFALAGLVVCSTSASAVHDFNVACENGQNYTLRTRAVSDDGDLVTGYFVVAPRRAIHVRLIPMGNGYRYAGRGIWLDGIRESAILNFGQHSAVACTVTPLGAVAVRALN